MIGIAVVLILAALGAQAVRIWFRYKMEGSNG